MYILGSSTRASFSGDVNDPIKPGGGFGRDQKLRPDVDTLGALTEILGTLGESMLINAPRIISIICAIRLFVQGGQ
jgi:hypothetical protein